MMRKLDIEVLSLPLGRPFAISRGTRTSVTVVRVSLEQNGFIGLGECTPTGRYQQTAESVVAEIKSVQSQIEAGMSRESLQDILPNGSARNVLDCALWRLEAACHKHSLWQEVGMIAPASVVTAETLSLDSLASMVSAAGKAVQRGASLLKIKLDQQQIIEKVAGIRAAAPEATLIIDANEAWETQNLPALFNALMPYHITMIEQPLPAGRDQRLADFPHSIPVCADESCHVADQIMQLSDRYEFINIKLDKCGGLTHALTMVNKANAAGMRVMVGCMLGSSLAMEAALPIAAQAELVDLDGPIWLAADNSPYLQYQQGQIWL